MHVIIGSITPFEYIQLLQQLLRPLTDKLIIVFTKSQSQYQLGQNLIALALQLTNVPEPAHGVQLQFFIDFDDLQFVVQRPVHNELGQRRVEGSAYQQQCVGLVHSLRHTLQSVMVLLVVLVEQHSVGLHYGAAVGTRRDLEGLVREVVDGGQVHRDAAEVRVTRTLLVGAPHQFPVAVDLVHALRLPEPRLPLLPFQDLAAHDLRLLDQFPVVVVDVLGDQRTTLALLLELFLDPQHRRVAHVRLALLYLVVSQQMPLPELLRVLSEIFHSQNLCRVGISLVALPVNAVLASESRQTTSCGNAGTYS